MAELGISSADYTAMNAINQKTETQTDFRRTVLSAEQSTPGVRYTPEWSKWFGYYKVIPELQSVINKKATWTVGKGYQADSKTKKLLDRIRGNGKDTFDDIMWNMVVAYTTGGDAFAEIIRNKRGELINLKPINPGSITIISDDSGIITRYEQTVLPMAEEGAVRKTKILKFQPKEIFHLPWQRLGDEPHGRSTIEKLQDIIDARNEAMKDIRIVFHRYVKPLLVSEVDTDDEAEISAYKTKVDKAVENMENLIIPKGTATMERISIPQYSTLDPLPYIRVLQQFFIISEGVPEVILGYGRDTTEASSKILYLAFQQNIEHNQLFLEKQIKTQLKLDVNFEFPAKLDPHMEEDVRKERAVNNFSTSKGVKT